MIHHPNCGRHTDQDRNIYSGQYDSWVDDEGSRHYVWVCNWCCTVVPVTPEEAGEKRKMTFKQWMDEINAIVWETVGCSVYDLPDCFYRVWYEDELLPAEAAERAIEGGE